MSSERVTRYYGTSKKKKIANMVIAILALIALFVVLVTIYGQNVGNFVISVDADSQINLALSDTPDFEDPKSRLSARGVNGMTHATYADVPSDIAVGSGSKNDDVRRRYFAYSFYIKNTSSTVVNYDMEMKLTGTDEKQAEKALRVMIIKDDVTNIYAAPKADGTPEDQGPYIQKDYTNTSFLSDVTLLTQREVGFTKDAVIKYTVVMWLEGWDPECVDEIKGAFMRMEITFSAYESSLT